MRAQAGLHREADDVRGAEGAPRGRDRGLEGSPRDLGRRERHVFPCGAHHPPHYVPRSCALIYLCKAFGNYANKDNIFRQEDIQIFMGIA